MDGAETGQTDSLGEKHYSSFPSYVLYVRSLEGFSVSGHENRPGNGEFVAIKMCDSRQLLVHLIW